MRTRSSFFPMRHTAQWYRLFLILCILPGMVLGPLARVKPVSAQAIPAAAGGQAPSQEDGQPVETRAHRPDAAAPYAGLPPAASQAEGLALTENQPTVCAADKGRVRCRAASQAEADAWNAPPELAATFKGEASPLLTQNSAAPAAARGITMTVDTAAATMDGDVTSVNALIATPGADGHISFLEALSAINNTGNGYGIAFAPTIQGQTISFGDGTLVLWVDNTTINGDIDGNGKPDIRYDGPQGYIALRIFGSNNTIKGMAIANLSIEDNASGNIITKNYIGTDLTTTSTANRQGNGVQIVHNAHDNRVTDNIIAGNVIPDPMKDGSGVLIGHTAYNNVVTGNTIGVDIVENILSNEIGVGIGWGAYDNIIGGVRTTPAGCGSPCNLISGNTRNGVLILGQGTDRNIVNGNFIGTDSAGAVAIPNVYSAVWIGGGAQDNTIGSLACSLRPCNLISGNVAEGVVIDGQGTKNTRVFGNYIGLTLNGMSALPNGKTGVLIQNKANNIDVGWHQPGTDTCTGGCNLISGNGEAGVGITGGASFNTVSGNFIGANANLSANLPNGTYGVVIADSSKNAIGQFMDSDPYYQGNHIYGNKSGGILVYRTPGGSDPTSKNPMLQNVFSGNQGMLIDLAPNAGLGVDPGGNGPNDGLTAPVLMKIDKEHWRGRASAPDGSTVALYADNGKTYLASATVTNFDFTFDMTGKKNITPPLVATVTDLDKNTSEFSAQARLHFISNALPGQKIFAFATLTNTLSGTLQTPAPDVTVQLQSNIVSFQNDGENGDMFAKDAYTSGYLTAPASPGVYDAFLFVNGARVAMTTLTVSRYPFLAVLTDLTALRDEFINVGSKTTAQDIYRGLYRIKTYASAHDGVVIDVRQEIPGYSALNYYNVNNRVSMGQKIDAWINTQLSKYRDMHYLVIVGDDAVIPFYRAREDVCASLYITHNGRKEKVSCEQGYAWHWINKYPAMVSNPTMQDIARGYRLSDTQYATIGMRERIPSIDYALGRVFAKTPKALFDLFDAYEKPVFLNPANDSASLISLPDKKKCGHKGASTLDCVATLTQRNTLPLVRATFSNVVIATDAALHPSAAGTTYLFSNKVRWTSGSITQSLSDAELVMIVTHASQFHMYTRKGHNLHASDIRNVSPGPNPTLFSTAGCHTGLSIARKGEGYFYANSLPAATLEQHIPFIAPMNYSWASAIIVMETMLGYAVSQKSSATVGDLFRNMQRLYAATMKVESRFGVHTVRGYQDYTIRHNLVLYGLPTQPVKYTGTPAAPDVMPLTPSILAPSASETHALDLTVDVPDFQQVTQPDGSLYFRTPNNGTLRLGTAYPILPEIVQVYRLPISSTVTSISLSGALTHTTPFTYTPATADFETLNGPAIPGAVPLTQTYPSQVYWYGSAQVDGSTLLYVGINPVQYDPSTQRGTLYDRVQLHITYQSPASYATLTGITVNGGGAVSTGMSSLPLQFSVQSAQPANLTLAYEITDRSGTPVAQGSTTAVLSAGSNTINLTTDTLGWNPGPMLLVATLADAGGVVDTFSAPFTAQGNSLEAATSQVTYGAEITTTLYADVYDQDGAGVAGQSGVFTATLDGTPLTLAFTEPLTGQYQAPLSLGALSEGLHFVTVGLPGSGTADTVIEIDHTAPTATLDSLPLNFPGLAIPVSGAGSQDVDYYEIQYAVGTTTTWSTWMTVTASTEAYPALDPLAFGPYAPVATQYGQWYYFRTRAVDRAGNAGAFSPYTETYLLPSPAVAQDKAIASVVELTNQVRAAQSPPLPPLKRNLLLNDSAQSHSDDTAYNGLSGHTGSDGSAPEDRIYRSGYDYLYAGENWAAGQQTPADVVNAWVSSPAHFANLVNPLYREIGVGYTFYPLDTNNSFHYWVQNFGARQDVYPVIINGEAQTTTLSTVNLYVYGQGWAQDMRVSNDPAFSGASWQPYTSTLSWTLSPGTGQRAVYVELRKSVTETQVVSDTIYVGGSLPSGVDLGLTKSDAPDPAQAGEPLTYTLTVVNNGASQATGVYLFDTLPAGLNLQSASASWGLCSAYAGTVTCNLASLEAGESTTVTLVVIPGSVGVFSNTAFVTAYESDSNTADNSATATTTVKGGGAADLLVTKTDSPDPAYLGTITYTIRLENQGPDNALNPVLTDTLPAGMTFSGVQATSGFACAHNSGVVTCSQTVLNNGQTVTATITAAPASEGVYTNTVTAALDSSQVDPDTGNNTATTVTTVTRAFVVNSTGDGADSNTGDGLCDDGSGNCTLRAAIQQANATPGLDIIAFNVPGGGVHTIQPLSALPPISDTVYLDAATQPGYAGTPLIEIDGTSAGFFVDGMTLDFGADGSTIRALAINRFEGNGILISGANNLTIRDNLIGTDPTGVLDQGNGGDGIYLSLSSNNTIQDNLLSGNGSNGLGLYSANQNQVISNTIGTNFLGLAALANDFSGILVSGGMTNTIQDNLISGNAWRGVYLFDTGTQNNKLLGNKIGTNALGTAAIPNAAFGVQLENAAYNQIGGPNPGDGNLISGNGASGIMVGDPINFTTTADVGHLIQGNKIGTNISGTAAIPNGDQGIRIGSHIVGSFFRYGGTDLQILDNLISGNTAHGLFLVGATALVQGNTIGTDISGSAALGNGGSGIYVGPTYFTHTLKANLISGNNNDGIEIQKDYWSAYAVIQGNTIGTDVTGSAALGNNAYGIEVDGTVLIGGPNPGDGNLISRNGNHGIKLWSPFNTIQGNIIGLNAAGNAPLGNLGDGINASLQSDQTINDNLIGANQNGMTLGGSSTVQGNTIGTDIAGALDLGNLKFGIDTYYSSYNDISGNTIAFNGYSGILNDSGIQNRISANAVYSNTQLGIDLDNDLVTPNDAGDADTGGNNRQNYPVITAAAAGSSGVYLSGTLNSAADTTYRLEFFASPQCDSSGYGEGRDYLGFTTVTTDGSGNAAFSLSLSTGSTAGYALTATATDPDGNTSEFSQCATLGLQADLSVSKSVTPNPVDSGSPVTYTLSVLNNGPSNASGVTLTDTLPAGLTFGSASASQGSCGYAAGVLTCTLGVLNGGDSADVTLVVTPTLSGNLTNQVQVTASESDPDTTNNSTSVDLAVDPADLSLTQTASPDPAFSGAPLTYTLTIANNGPLTATGLTLTDTLPGSVTFLSASAGCAHAGGLVTCALGNLARGGSLSATIVVSPTAPGLITNTASVRADQGDPALSDNTRALALSVDPADLALTKTALSDPATANQPLAYRLVLANNGPGAATQIVLTDNLPTGLAFISASSGDPNVPCGYSSGTVTCATNSLAAGNSVTITLNVTPTVTGRITNTVSVTQLNPDPDAANNSASAGVTIQGGVDLRLTKTAQPDPALYQQPLTYTLVVTNAGALPATGIVLTDHLSAQVTYLSATGTQGSCTHTPAFGGDWLNCSLGNLNSGGLVTVTAVVSPTDWGTWLDAMVVNTATVTSAQADANPLDNDATLAQWLRDPADDRWDDRFSLPGTDGNVTAMTVSSDGALYISGDFSAVGDVPAYNLARWDGSAWTAVAGGLNMAANALLEHNGSLYVGGGSLTFYETNRTSPVTGYLAAWDGSRWHTLGSSVDSTVNALALSPNGELYAGGDFTSAGGVSVNGLAVWDGSSWADVGGGVTSFGFTGSVNALAVDPANGDLYVAGSFDTAGSVSAAGIARWDGSQWHALGGGAQGTFRELLVQNGTVTIIGGFWDVGGNGSASVAQWDGSAWTTLVSQATYFGGFSGEVYNAAYLGNALYIAGFFDTLTDGQSNNVTAHNIARWDGSAWAEVGSDGVGHNRGALLAVRVIAAQGSKLFVGGDFGNAGSTAASHIAQWDGSAWGALASGQGMPQIGSGNIQVEALATAPNGEVYAGGYFPTAGGGVVNHIARWDGGQWHALGSGITLGDGTYLGSPDVRALAFAANGDLYAGGNIKSTATISANYVIRWDGSAWYALGSGMDDNVNALAVAANGDLYAGGDFFSAGGATVNYVARWNGSAWSALGGGTDAPVKALAIDPNTGDLYVGGEFTSAGGITNTAGIARWDGVQWHAVGGGTGYVYALAFAPNGDLYAAGQFTSAGGVAANTIARWDGSQWHALGSGLGGGSGWSPVAYALAVNGSDVYVTGDFTDAGGVPVNRIARWDGSAWHALGSGLLSSRAWGGSGAGYALTIGDAGLYAGGLFKRAGNKPSENIALWRFANPDLTVTQSAAPDPAASGQPLTYTLTVVNNGLLDATAVALTDTLPSGVTYGSAAASQGGCIQAGGVVTCSLGGLAMGASAQVQVAVTPQSGGLISNTLTAVPAGQTDMNPADNSSVMRIAVAPADLTLGLRAAPNPARFNQPLTYTLTITNNGPLSASGLTLTDTLPGAAVFGSASASQGGCIQAGGALTCTLGSLSSGAAATVSVVVTPTGTSALTSSMGISAATFDPHPSDNHVQSVLSLAPYLNAFDGGIPPGWKVIDGGDGRGSTATWTARNPCQRAITTPASAPWLMVDSDCAGIGDTQDEQLISPVFDGTACTSIQVAFSNQFRAHALEIGDVDVSVDGGLTWVNALRLQGISEGYPTPVTRSLDISALAAGNPFQVRFYYRNAHFDWWWAIDDFSLTCSKAAPQLPALSLTQQDSADPLTAGNALTYQVTVANTGAYSATDVVLSDTLPVSATFGAAAASQGSCTLTSDSAALRCPLGSLPPGGSAQVSVVLTPTVTGLFTNTAFVAAAQMETVMLDNTSVETATVITPSAGALQLGQSAYSLAEDGGTLTVTVQRVGGSAGSVTVDYATADGTASAGADYTAISGTLTFADGETSKSLLIPILDDTLDEPDETFTLTLSNPSGGASLGSPAQAAVTITNVAHTHYLYLPLVIR